MNTVEELKKLDRDLQKIRNKYANRFKKAYSGVISAISNNDRIIDEAERANKSLRVDAVNFRNAYDTATNGEGEL